MMWMVIVATVGLTGVGPAAPPADVPPLRAAAAPAVDLLESDRRRVRAVDGQVAHVLKYGIARSPTFAGLVAQVQASNVIVYIEAAFSLPPDVTGRLMLQVASGRDRYLRVQIKAVGGRDQQVALIAHELHHALEIAAEAAVTTDAAVAALYRRIGHVSHGLNGYDTEGARQAARRVREELLG